MIESFDNIPNNSSQNPEKNPKEVESPPEETKETKEAKEVPEFNEDRIDRVRLKAAIEIAQEGNTATKRFTEKRDLRFEGMDENGLREEVGRAEKRDNEAEVLRLEELILAREKERRAKDSAEEDATPADSQEKQKKTTETHENEAPEDSESVNQEAREGKKEHTGTYAERLSALAQEKDPLGLARVALQETFDALGTTEVEYMRAGPFELLVAADKLSVVRELEAFKEKTRKNAQLSEKDYAIHLKGLIYDKVAKKQTDFEEDVRERRVDEARVEVSEESETPEEPEEVKASESVEEPSPEELTSDTKEIPPAEASVEQQEEVPASSLRSESFEAEEPEPAELTGLKDSSLLSNVIQGLHEHLLTHLKNIEGVEDATKFESAIEIFNTQVENLFSKKKEGVDARASVSKSLEDFLSGTDLSPNEQEPYKKVLTILSRDELARPLEEAA